MTARTKTTHLLNRDQSRGDKLPLGLHIAGWAAFAWAIVVLLIDLNADKLLGR